jgi:hypothetical protein
MSASETEKAGTDTDLSRARGTLAGATKGRPEHAVELLEGAVDIPRPAWPVVDWLPIPLAVELPVPEFRVRDMLALEVGSIVVTQWPNGDDLPLTAGTVQLAWVDVEVVDQTMSVRLTRLL